MQKTARFSIFTHWVSYLGDSRAKSYILFNLIVVCYSVFNLLFAINILSFLVSTFPVRLSIILFYTTSLLVILLLFFPLNKNYKVHRILSDIMFTLIFVALILIFYPLYTSSSIPFLLVLFLAATILINLLFVASFTLLRIKYGEIPKTLIDIRKKERSLLIKNAFFLEWLFFASLVCFQLILFIYTL